MRLTKHVPELVQVSIPELGTYSLDMGGLGSLTECSKHENIFSDAFTMNGRHEVLA